MAKQKQEPEKMPNRFRDDLEQRNADDNALKANLSSPANLKQYKLDTIKYLNDLERKYGQMINPDEKRWQNHIKINRDALVKEVYNTPIKKLGRFLNKMVPRETAKKVWSNIKKGAGNLGNRIKDRVPTVISSAFAGIKNAVAKNLEKVRSAVGNAGKKVLDGLKTGVQVISAIVLNPVGLITEGLQAVTDFLKWGLEGRHGLAEKHNARNGQDHIWQAQPKSLLDQLRDRVVERNQAKQARAAKTFKIEQLKEFLTQKGYGSVIPELDHAIARGETDFQLTTKRIINSEPVKQELNFSNNKDGKMQFDSVNTVVRDPNNPGSFREFKAPVNGSKTLSGVESYKLLNGETICRHELNQQGELVKQLYRLNENDMKYNPRNVGADKFVADPEHVRNVVNALPLPPGATPEYKNGLVNALTSGERPLVALQENGIKTEVYMQVGTVPGLMKYADVNHKPVKYSDVKAVMNPPKKVSQKVDQEKQTRSSKKRPQVRR